MKKLILLLAVTALPTISPGLALAGCPAVDPLRNRLVAQVDASVQRIASTKNCALIPGHLALVARANAIVNQAFINNDCYMETPGTSASQIEAALRKLCDPSGSKSTAQTAATLPPAKTASAPKKLAVKEAKAAAPVTRPAQEQAAAPPPNPGQQQSADCSTITGLGGGSGSSNCTPSNGVPPNVQAQINQAQSYMQAAQTVKQSDPSYNGWSAAAAQYRRAEAAFRAAGDLAQAAAAAEQAQTLENALKIADQKAGRDSAANQSSPSTQPASPAARQTAPTDLCENLHSNAIGMPLIWGNIPVADQFYNQVRRALFLIA